MPTSVVVVEPPHARRFGLAATTVGLTAVAVYWNSLGNGFALDDMVVLVENPPIHDLSAPLRILLTPYWPGAEGAARGAYRPLTELLFALQWRIGDGSPFPFHFANVLLHAMASVLVLGLLRSLVRLPGALAGALLFAVHPVHVEAVANGVGQAELTSAVLLLGAAVAYLHSGRGPPSLPRSLGVALLYAAATLCKEHAIVLPALLVALDVARGRVGRRGYIRSRLPLALLLAGVAVNYLALRSIVLGGSLSGQAAAGFPFLLDTATRIRTALSLWPEYARLLFFPLDLSATYDPATLSPQTSLSPGVLAGAVLLLFVVASILHPRGWPEVGLGSTWFLVTVLPVSNLILPIGILLAERTLYLPSVALAVWAAHGVDLVWQRLDRRRRVGWVAVPGLILLVACSLRVVDRNPVWANNDALFASMLRNHPESFRSQWFEALRLARAGDTTTSLEHWTRADSIFPGNATFLTQYAGFLRSAGRLESADAVVERALDLAPASAAAHLIKGLLDRDRGLLPRARERVRILHGLGLSGVADQLSDSISARGSPP